MTPTLFGRIQTRLVVVLVVGLVWTLIITPALPADGLPLGDVYAMTFRAVFITAILGAVLWEPLYHFAQQYRWEKDWPTGLGLLTGIPEGIVVLAVLEGSGPVPLGAFLLHFTTTWLLIWFVVNGPLRVVLPRWRFRGGRFF
ncbi:MAG: hypothetical protein ACR2QK_25240 [Acidimicrobiales bacterium]